MATARSKSDFAQSRAPVTGGGVQLQFIDEQERRRDKRSHLRFLIRSNATKSTTLWKRQARSALSVPPSIIRSEPDHTGVTELDARPTSLSRTLHREQSLGRIGVVFRQLVEVSSILGELPTSLDTPDGSSVASDIISANHETPLLPDTSLCRQKFEEHKHHQTTKRVQASSLIQQDCNSRHTISRQKCTDKPGGQHSRSSHHRPSVQSLLGAGKVDPFNSLPVRMGPHMYRLIEYYIQVCVAFPQGHVSFSNTYSKWMNLCVQDEMALLSMLFAAETSNRSHHGIDPWSARAHSLGIQCVRSLTTEIGKEKGVTDVMIATVIHLAAVELLSGDLAKYREHVKGLQDMVHVRGGLADEKSGQMKYLKGMVVWITQLGTPSLPCTQHDSIGTSSQQELHNSSSASSNISHELVVVLKKIQTLTMVRNECAIGADLTAIPPVHTPASRHHKEACVKVLKELQVLQGRTNITNSSLQTACILAASIYVDLVLLKTPLASVASSKINRQLHHSIMSTRNANEGKNTSEILTWVSAVAAAAMGRSQDSLVDKFEGVVTCFDALSLESFHAKYSLL
ncbi:hypothetical protein L207DRAFT_577740 [Hyaloscypha variabilis F]|uniref:Transcription factor domain-containing protein n=1 Tax=Hyaloscypha variabilis (strain UAMH 11265 / GT02V1 / F) TaxID=1149755 RepID=A0A2J6S808_HYAVF|nr:hypothetical protein L207DRAFT_577740 [Hyaloscypha variabilis F]